jgi:antitoxin component YwqK of YwqJK toxin-antitoxin module
MARKPAHWIIALVLGLGLTGGRATARGEDSPTPAKPPVYGSSRLAAADADAAEPAALTADQSAGSTADDAENNEVIRERYPNSAIKIERHVTQDAEGNYYNHGLWSQWDEKGHLVGNGEYRYGKRQGRWVRQYAAGEAPMLAGTQYKDFQPPFIAEASFEDGQINGVWRVVDAKGRKISEWEFDHGERNGKSVWYYPNGQKRREVDYRQGDIDGEVLEFGFDNKVASRDKYVEGRRLAMQVDYYGPGQKRSEGMILFAKEITKSNYDFWTGTATIQVVGTEGTNQRCGAWSWWHKNGQKQMEGQYEADMPVGKFAWWYANGQKQLQGEYISGKQQGRFTWWHDNGQKQLEGDYIAGVLTGKWTRWNKDGRVVEVGDYSPDGKQIADEPRPLPGAEESTAPTLEAVQPSAPATSSRLKR